MLFSSPDNCTLLSRQITVVRHILMTLWQITTTEKHPYNPPGVIAVDVLNSSDMVIFVW